MNMYDKPTQEQRELNAFKQFCEQISETGLPFGLGDMGGSALWQYLLDHNADLTKVQSYFDGYAELQSQGVFERLRQEEIDRLKRSLDESEKASAPPEPKKVLFGGLNTIVPHNDEPLDEKEMHKLRTMPLKALKKVSDKSRRKHILARPNGEQDLKDIDWNNRPWGTIE